MEFEHGKRDGGCVAPIGEGLESTRARFFVDVQRVLTRTDSRIAAARHASDVAAERAAAADAKLAASRLALTKTREWRAEYPGDFDVKRGWLYLSISVLLIFSDIALLGRALAQFLGIPYIDKESGESFLGSLFSTTPWRLFTRHPDLASLTFGLLLIGLFMKVWRDLHRSGPMPGPHPRLVTWERWGATLLFFLATSCIVVVAYARTQASTDANATTSPGGAFVTFLIGLALPLVGAGFFIRGYDLLFAAWTLRVLDRDVHVGEEEAERIREASSRVFEELAQLDGRKRRYESDAFVVRLLEVRQAEFVQGYREGVATALAAEPGSLYYALKPLAAQRKVLEGMGL